MAWRKEESGPDEDDGAIPPVPVSEIDDEDGLSVARAVPMSSLSKLERNARIAALARLAGKVG